MGLQESPKPWWSLMESEVGLGPVGASDVVSDVGLVGYMEKGRGSDWTRPRGPGARGRGPGRVEGGDPSRAHAPHRAHRRSTVPVCAPAPRAPCGRCPAPRAPPAGPSSSRARRRGPLPSLPGRVNAGFGTCAGLRGFASPCAAHTYRRSPRSCGRA